jgi:endoglucanase
MAATFDRRQILAGVSAVALTCAPSLAATALASRVAALAHGLNIPDLVPMRAARAPERRTLERLRARGMTHIRLPIYAERVLPHFSDADVVSRTLDDLDRALDTLLANGYAVSVDMHPNAGLPRLYQRDPNAAFEALSEGWLLLAKRLRGRPTQRVFAELLNEPPTQDALWRAQAEKLVARLRGHLPDMTMIVGPAPWQRVEALAAWTPLSDANIIYAFHYYDPMAFTHQGETWDVTSPYAQMAGVPFPIEPNDPKVERLRTSPPLEWSPGTVKELVQTLSRPWTETTIGQAFEPLATWSRTHSAPVVLNEFGVLRFKARPADRAAWIGAVRRQAEKHGFGWAHWEYSNGFGLLDEDGRPNPHIVDALLPKNGRTPT